MSIIDAIKNSVLEGFNTDISGVDIALSLLVSLLAGLFILTIYQRTQRQTTMNRSFCISLLLLCSISAMIVLSITSNLALSLGMVGALSIVRFRTAIKDASDTAFLFWAVAAGITSGARFYLLTLVGCFFVGLVCVVAVLLFDKVSKPFLLVLRTTDAAAKDQADVILKKSGLKYSVTSIVTNSSCTEVIYELGLSGKNTKFVSDLKGLPGVTTVSLVNCHKS